MAVVLPQTQMQGNGGANGNLELPVERRNVAHLGTVVVELNAAAFQGNVDLQKKLNDGTLANLRYAEETGDGSLSPVNDQIAYAAPTTSIRTFRIAEHAREVVAVISGYVAGTLTAFADGKEAAGPFPFDPTHDHSSDAEGGATLGAHALSGDLDLNGKGFANGFEALQDLLQEGTRLRPSNNAGSGWTAAHISGGSVINDPIVLSLRSNATGGGIGLVHNELWGLYPVGGGVPTTVDWTKKLHLKFVIIKETNSANGLAYIQMKAATTQGDLAAIGMGLKIDNLVLTGEVHDGSTRSTVGSSVLTVNRAYEVVIEWDGSSLWEIFLDGVSLGTLTSDLPSGTTAGMKLIVSSGNGGDATDNRFYVNIQEITSKD